MMESICFLPSSAKLLIFAQKPEEKSLQLWPEVVLTKTRGIGLVLVKTTLRGLLYFALTQSVSKGMYILKSPKH